MKLYPSREYSNLCRLFFLCAVCNPLASFRSAFRLLHCVHMCAMVAPLHLPSLQIRMPKCMTTCWGKASSFCNLSLCMSVSVSAPVCVICDVLVRPSLAPHVAGWHAIQVAYRPAKPYRTSDRTALSKGTVDAATTGNDSVCAV